MGFNLGPLEAAPTIAPKYAEQQSVPPQLFLVLFSRYRQTPIDPIIEGKTAMAINAFTSKSPAAAAAANEPYQDMDIKMIANMMNRMIAGKDAEWDQYSGWDSDTNMDNKDGR
ncbi:hypothetical protein TruAng_003474 [Truncatella angustata]|nr:hypothetical protein TruAng_003474 [Truncatella angustata]